MAAARFREQASRMDALLVDRLGDRALLADGRELSGAFSSPDFGDERKGGTHRFSLGNVANPEEVTQPTFTMRTADAVGVKKGEELDVQVPPHEGGGLHVVVSLMPDGSGMVNLVLRRAHERAATAV